MLRIDMYMAEESRARFAHLCVQIDVDKPLITTILIVKLQQPVSYESIQSLCFGYGRVGHRREGCPYLLHRGPLHCGPSQESLDKEETIDRSDKACDLHEANTTRTEAGPSSSMQEEANGNVQEDQDTSEQGVSNAGHGAARRHVEKGMDDGDQADKNGDCALPDSGFLSSCVRPSYRDGSSATMCDAEATDKMEFEGEGHLDAAF
nr:hypothetical protein CFP56_43126 [Quercus suber]